MTKTGHTVTLSRGADQWTRWRGIAESPADAERLALREAGLAFRILSAQYPEGPARLPDGLRVTETLNLIYPGECAGTEIHQAMREAAHKPRRTPLERWSADEAIAAGRAIVRLIALTHPLGLEHLMTHTAGLQVVTSTADFLRKSAGFGEGGYEIAGSSYTADLAVLATGEGAVPDFYPLDGPWRDAMLACSLGAAATGRDGQGVALQLETPESATVRALEAANQKARMATDARTVIAFMEKAGLREEALPFGPATGAAPWP